MALRQKTWGVFIRPYMTYAGEILPQRGTVSIVDPCQNSGGSTKYTTLNGGESYMLYNSKNEAHKNPITSFEVAKAVVKEVMDDLGYSINDIILTEIVPKDHMILPIA